MPTTNHKLRVFLCHASEDKPIVRKLYKKLLTEQWIDPWLDEEKLLPGHNFDLEINKAMREADVIIICLSSVSVTKEGYLNKEIRRALDIAEEKLEGKIYIIPLRLDNCNPSFEQLKKLQWLNYFENNGYEKLKKSLVQRFEDLDEQISSNAGLSDDSNKILLRPFTGHKGGEKNLAWLVIENHTDTDLRDCYLELKLFDRHEKTGFVDCKDHVTINTDKFAWADFQKHEEKVVRKKSSARVNIAKLVPSERAIRLAEERYYEHAAKEIGHDPRLSQVPINDPAVREFLTDESSNGILRLAMADGNHEAFPVRRNFYIEVAFNGQIDNIDIPEIVFRGFLIHDRLGDLVEFQFAPGEKAEYNTLLKRLLKETWFDALLPEEKEYYKEAQPWRDWDASRSP